MSTYKTLTFALSLAFSIVTSSFLMAADKAELDMPASFEAKIKNIPAEKLEILS